VVIVEIRSKVYAERSLSQKCSAWGCLERAEHRKPVIMFGVSPRRLYCELRDHRVFITPNDLSQARAARFGSAQFGASAFGHERRYVRQRGEKALSEQRGSITQGSDVHTRVLSSNRSATRTRPLFINLPELELRAAQDKPPRLLVFPRDPRRRNSRPYLPAANFQEFRRHRSARFYPPVSANTERRSTCSPATNLFCLW